jgi:hypothetical protein
MVIKSQTLVLVALGAALTLSASGALAQPGRKTYYVGPQGSDLTGDGSARRPWASLRHATSVIPDIGARLGFLDGSYGPQSMSRAFRQPVLVQAHHPYRARWTSATTRHRVLHVAGAANVTLSGFEMRGRPGGNDDYLVQITLAETQQILLHDNIIHDSYKNDIIKINDGAHHIRVYGNVFYNQPRTGDEHLDINTVHDVAVEDNVFFNDFAASRRPVQNISHPFVLIKNSGSMPQSRNFLVRGNIFLNWEGKSDQPYLLLGEDAKPFHEAENVVIENNLFLGNTGNRMTAAFAVKGAKNVRFRANTVHGALPLGADLWGFAMRLGREGANPRNENIAFVNNIWSDPTGTMTHFAAGKPENTVGASLRNNLYWNGGKAIPVDPDRVLNASDDPRAILKAPGLPPDLRSVVPPVWNPSTHRFADGSSDIGQVRARLVERYGTPPENSPAIDAGDPTDAPKDDILHRPRGAKPDVGAVEVRP